ncbi:MAG: hypothetical protein NTW78_02620 [Campylobacterales bacterium]|nr:hypothetical protein [Campylobacterales bacterium]
MIIAQILKDEALNLKLFKPSYIKEIENSIFKKEVRGENKWHNQ